MKLLGHAVHHVRGSKNSTPTTTRWGRQGHGRLALTGSQGWPVGPHWSYELVKACSRDVQKQAAMIEAGSYLPLGEHSFGRACVPGTLPPAHFDELWLWESKTTHTHRNEWGHGTFVIRVWVAPSHPLLGARTEPEYDCLLS